MPLSPIFWNVFKAGIPRQRKSRRLRAPTRHAGETIGIVADHRQVVRYRLWLHSEFGDHAGFIAQNVAPAVQLNDSRAHHALAEIFIRSADEDLLHTFI